MTYEQLQMPGCGLTESPRKQSRYYRPDFRASRILLQEKVKGIVTSATYGEKLQDVSEKFVRDGSSVKIRRVYFQGRINGTLIEYCATLPKWGIVYRGECGELATSERLISENGCLLPLTTPTCQNSVRSAKFRQGRTPNLMEFVEKFPTPLASDAIRVRYSEESLIKVGTRRLEKGYTAAGCNLSEYVAVFPTPMATGWGNTGARKKLKKTQAEGIITAEECKKMQSGGGGKLNPTWVEWLMGFPLGWTDLDV